MAMACEIRTRTYNSEYLTGLPGNR